MDDNSKRRFDAILELYKQCWHRVTERRVYEWRATFAVWAAFAAFAGIVLTNQSTQFLPRDWPIVLVLSLVGLALCGIHFFWLQGLGRRHAQDRKEAFFYLAILQELSQSTFQRPDENPSTVLRDWSRKYQWLITVVLCVLTLAILIIGFLAGVGPG